MKSFPTSRHTANRLLRLGNYFLLASIATTTSTYGAPKTWSGLHPNAGNTSWGVGQNWLDGAPVAGDSLVFAGTVKLLASNPVGGTSYAGITFAADAGAFTLSGAGLVLTGDVVNSSSSLQTLDFTSAVNGIALNGSGLSFNASTADMLVQTKITTNGNLFYAQALADKTLTLNGDIVGDGSMEKRGPGTVILGGSNSYTGATTLNRGTLQISSANNLAGTSGVTFTAAATDTTLHVTADGVNLNKAITQTGQGNYRVDSNHSLTLSGVISGDGNFNKIGEGTVVLDTTNTFTGATTLTEGILAISSTNNLRDTSGITFANGTAAVLYATANGIDLGKTITQTGQGSYKVDAANTLTLSGTIAGAGGFNKLGDGTVILGATNTFAGTTTLTSGTLAISSTNNLRDTSGITFASGTTAVLHATADGINLSKNITQTGRGSYTVNSGNTLTLSGTISGAGGFLKKGLGTAILSATNTFTGNTILDQGTLKISSASNLLGSTGIEFTSTGSDTTLHVTANGVNLGANILQSGQGNYQVDSGNTLTLGGNITGSGGFRTTGGGNVFLTGSNSFTGATTLGSGTLGISSSNNFKNTSGIALSGFGTTTLYATADGVTVNADITQSALAIYRAGSGNKLTLNGAISGAGAFEKVGEGTVVLGGVNTYTGSTELTSGTLGITTASNLQGTSGLHFVTGSQTTTLYVLADGVNLAKTILQDGPGNYRVDAGHTLTLSGVVSGFGQFRKDGEGTIILNASNTYSGKTVVNAGTLRLGAGGNIINANMDVLGGTLDMNGKNLSLSQTLTIGSGTTSGVIHSTSTTSTMTANGAISASSGTVSVDLLGAAGLTKSSTGTVTLSGSNNYLGGTTINNGVLRLGDGGTTGSITGDVSITGGNGTLAFNRSNAYSFGQTISSLGRVKQIGTGTTTLTGTNTYQGGTSVEAGFLVAGNNNALGTGAVLVSGSGETPSTKGTLVLGEAMNVANDITLSGGDVQRSIGSGAKYSLGTTGTVKSSFSADSYDNTIVSILDSDSSSGTILNYSMSAGPSGSVLNDYARMSDVFHIDLGGDSGADYFVLSISLETSLTTGYIAVLINDMWVNAGTYFAGNIDYSGSVTEGDYGITDDGAWVVLGKDSQYTLAVIPEPSISSLIGLMVLAGGATRILRRRN